MFEISTGKLLVVALIALLVLGPTQLTVLARKLGHLLNNARRHLAMLQQNLGTPETAAAQSNVLQPNSPQLKAHNANPPILKPTSTQQDT
jgi:Sec-independent protein translocase protein TatA